MDADKSDWDVLDLASVRKRCRELGAEFRAVLSSASRAATMDGYVVTETDLGTGASADVRLF